MATTKVKTHSRSTKGKGNTSVKSHPRKTKSASSPAPVSQERQDRFAKMWSSLQSDPKTAISQKQLKSAHKIMTKREARKKPC